MAVRKLPNGKWQVQYPSHRNSKGVISYRFKVTGYSKRKAEELDKKLYSDFKEREVWGIPHEPEKRKEYRVPELLDWYLHLDEVKSLKSFKTHVAVRIRPLMTFFQDKKAGALLPSDIAQYQAWRKAQKVRKHHKEEQIVCEQNISNAAVNREIGVLKRCFNLAIREQLLEKNACVGVKPLKETERNRICSPEEYETLRSELDGDARDIVVLAFHTGMRYAEIVKLDWSRVHLKERLICLRGEDTKNGEARKVPFRSEEVVEVFENRGRNPRRIRGRVFKVQNIRNVFEVACSKLGIKDLRFHDLRHTAATSMRKAGLDTATVMKICGWKSVQMFLRYNAVDDSDIQKANVGISLVEEKFVDMTSRK